jgi:nucleotidyltransferase AbiEii toxin of type IV toxin-antitoxin system
LGTGTIRLASYPPEMSLAEKVATMMSRRELNTRDRDFADTWVLSRIHRFAAGELRSAIVDVAAHREHDVVTLAIALADIPNRQQTYTAMLGRMAYQPVVGTGCRRPRRVSRAGFDAALPGDHSGQSWTNAETG